MSAEFQQECERENILLLQFRKGQSQVYLVYSGWDDDEDGYGFSFSMIDDCGDVFGKRS